MHHNHSLIIAQVLDTDSLDKVTRFVHELNRTTTMELSNLALQRAYDIDGPNASFRFDKGYVSSISPETATHLLIAQMARDTRQARITADKLRELRIITPDVHDAVLSLDVTHYIKYGEVRKARYYTVTVPNRGWTVTRPITEGKPAEPAWNDLCYGGPPIDFVGANTPSSKPVMTINKDNPTNIIVQQLVKTYDGLLWTVDASITHWLPFPTIEV